MREIDTENTTPSIAIVKAISDQTGLGITDFSLYEQVSPDALDELLDPKSSSVTSVQIMFKINGITVIVKREGDSARVKVEQPRGSGNSWTGP